MAAAVKVNAATEEIAARAARLPFGYAGANSVDFTDVIALEVNGVEDGNVYLTAEAASYLMYSLWSAGVEIPKEALA